MKNAGIKYKTLSFFASWASQGSAKMPRSFRLCLSASPRHVLRGASLFALMLAPLLGGCIGMSKSPSPRFYDLQAMAGNEENKKYNVPSSVIIGIGPVKAPEYLNRPQIVTVDENNMFSFAQFDRWGEPLDLALLRLFANNLSALMPTVNIAASPWNLALPVKYQVIMDVVRLECRLDKDVSLAVQWSVIDLENKRMVLTKRSEFSRPIDPRNYAGLVKTLSLECAELSGEIAESLSSLVAQPVKEGAQTPSQP